LADGVEKEEKQAAQNVPFEARNEIWLYSNPNATLFITSLCFGDSVAGFQEIR
jgi:hypothetical protein